MAVVGIGIEYLLGDIIMRMSIDGGDNFQSFVISLNLPLCCYWALLAVSIMSGIKIGLDYMKKVFGSSDTINLSTSEHQQPKSKSTLSLFSSTFKRRKGNHSKSAQIDLAVQSQASTRDNRIIPFTNPKNKIPNYSQATESSFDGFKNGKILGEISEEQGVGQQMGNNSRHFGGHKSMVHMGIRVKQQFQKHFDLGRRARFMSTGNLLTNDAHETRSPAHLQFQRSPACSKMDDQEQNKGRDNFNIKNEENQENCQVELSDAFNKSDQQVTTSSTTDDDDDDVNVQENISINSTSKEMLNFLRQTKSSVAMTPTTTAVAANVDSGTKGKPTPKARSSKCYEWVEKQGTPTSTAFQNISNSTTTKCTIIITGPDDDHHNSGSGSLVPVKPVPKPRNDKMC